jgi:hypothetical protein
VAIFATQSADSRQIQRTNAETIQMTFYSGETATDADGAVTIGIVDEAGTEVVASGTSTTSAGSGVYTYSLAGQSDLKRLTATWSGTWSSAMEFNSTHEIVGGFYTSPYQVRQMDSIEGETSTFPLTDIIQATEWAETVVEDYIGTSFVYRYQRDVLDGTNDQAIRLTKMFPRKILSASIDGTALTSAEINKIALYESGIIAREDSVWNYTVPGKKVIIEYEYGETKQPPQDIVWVIKTLTRFHLLEAYSRIPERATSIQNEFGTVILSQPSMGRPTPLPELNVVINRHRHRPPTAG